MNSILNNKLNFSKNHQSKNHGAELWLKANRPELHAQLLKGELTFQNNGTSQRHANSWFLVPVVGHDPTKPLAELAILRVVHGIGSNAPNTYQLTN